MSQHKELGTDGGKGSMDRTTDIRRYQAEFDRIFGKPATKPTVKREKTKS